MTSGARRGTARGRVVLGFRLGVIAIAIAQGTANAFSNLHDWPDLRPWEPFVWEYTSVALVIALIWPIGWLVRAAPPRPGGWLRFAAAHLAGSIAYCLIHVGGFVLLRRAAYALLGARYAGADLLYEYRKDLVSYAMIALALWVGDHMAKLLGRSEAPGAERSRIYEIRDGSRITRTPVDEIVAACSARNYVEFHLASGARPLARATLAAVEAELADAGFVRVHRSWLVNARRVRTVDPAGAGDFRIALEGGVEAPMSRRFREALDRIRQAA